MKTITTSLAVALSALTFLSAARADVIKLADGTVMEGTLSAPAVIVVKTAKGEERVPFSALAPEVQRLYWNKTAVTAAPTAATPEPGVAGPVTDEELDQLANEVNLEAWTQISAIGSFRDKPEKRGAGGLVVTKAFNALEENWVSVYSPKDPVGSARNWDSQVIKAKSLQTRATQFMQKRWLETFVQAGEAVSRRDSNEFATILRELKRYPTTTQAGTANGRNFFSAK